jgi:hypothetical protein
MGHQSHLKELILGITTGALAPSAQVRAMGDVLPKSRSLTALLKESAILGKLPTASPSSNLVEATRRASDVVLAARRDHERLAAWAKPFGDLNMTAWVSPREVAGLAAIARAQIWSDRLSGVSPTQLAGMMKNAKLVSEELSAIARATTDLGIAGLATADMQALFKSHRALEGTALKMSVFAGGLDVFGARGLASQSAFDSLFGAWRTRPGLPPAFWHDRLVRRGFYREADVDAGLVDANNGALLEILIESGVVEGNTSGKVITAQIQAGPVNVRVTASRPRVGAYRAISAFEVALRGFVAAKLEVAHRAAGADGRLWFNQRIPGNVKQRVRERRDAAKAAGEPMAHSLSFVDLGDFIAIVTQNINWSVFEPVFGSREGFRVDIERLNNIRRPAAHPRPIDPVQLAEAILTIHRLTAMIERDGGWDAAWDDDEA